ncbi:MAG TPA: bifunctional phosphopantothenoylcysteine decarboxylase/phosphopantothenate--cysteine ligase CoaBC [Lactobacillus sp.]|nr:bifunctional phosphopantothenoylcysteine decarboxylase/phosphopantothenate--cysteine ligase CoaBC [Lactobacillus sp.]
MGLENKHIAVYVTGGIAVYKAAEVVRGFIRQGAVVRVAMTQDATKFVTPLTFGALTKQPVLTDLFAGDNDQFVPHIALADWSDLAVIVPATANVIAKMATGLADDAVSTTLLATTGLKVVVPAMNEHMWDAPATTRNIATLTADGVVVMQPDTGLLAEGYSGRGRLPEPSAIVDFVQHVWAKQTGRLRGRNVMVTAGGTRERIDPVRYISNDSSGKMGYALARAAANEGANVTLISSIISLSAPDSVHVITVSGAQEMLDTMKTYFAQQDAVIMAAAVADFKPVSVAEQKIKKTADNDLMTLQLTKNPDILKTLSVDKTDQIMVGFAAETEHLLTNAQHKLIDKKLDMLIANDVSRKDIGFNADQNQVTVIRPNVEPVQLPQMTKTKLSEQLIEMIADLLPGK